MLAADARSFPSQEEVQQAFDTAVSQADLVIVEHRWMPWVPLVDEGARRVRVFEITTKESIRALAAYVRVIVPAPVLLKVDGHETWTRESFSVDTPECFEVTLHKDGAAFLSFAILGEDCIGSADLLKNSAIRVDPVAFAPFHRRITQFMKHLKANQQGDPTLENAPRNSGGSSGD